MELEDKTIGEKMIEEEQKEEKSGVIPKVTKVATLIAMLLEE